MRCTIVTFALLASLDAAPAAEVGAGSIAVRRMLLHDGLPLTEFARMPVTDCVDTYAKLDAAQDAEFNNPVEPESPEVRPMGVICERGKTEGRGEVCVELLTEQSDDRFGAPAPEVRLRLPQLPVEQLRDLGRRLLKAGSLKELGLTD